MRWRLWLAQSNTDGALHTLLRAMLVFTVLWLLAAGYANFAVRHTLQTAQQDAAAHKKQAEELVRDLKQKQVTVVQAAGLRTAAPDKEGSPEWAQRLTQIAGVSNVTLDGLKMTADLHPFIAPAPNAAGANGNGPNGSGAAPASNGTNPANGVAGNNGNGNTPPPVDPDDGWKKAKFDCAAIGTYRSLTDFLARLNETPYVLEIASADMTRDKYNAATGELRLRLKLTLTLYGMPDSQDKLK